MSLVETCPESEGIATQTLCIGIETRKARLKPALNQKGLRLHTYQNSRQGGPHLVETCPESEGIATPFLQVHQFPYLLYLVETCPESEGIATQAEISKFKLENRVETCPESEGIATSGKETGLARLFALKPALNQKGLRRLFQTSCMHLVKSFVETCPESEGIATS